MVIILPSLSTCLSYTVRSFRLQSPLLRRERVECEVQIWVEQPTDRCRIPSPLSRYANQPTRSRQLQREAEEEQDKHFRSELQQRDTYQVFSVPIQFGAPFVPLFGRLAGLEQVVVCLFFVFYLFTHHPFCFPWANVQPFFIGMQRDSNGHRTWGELGKATARSTKAEAAVGVG